MSTFGLNIHSLKEQIYKWLGLNVLSFLFFSFTIHEFHLAWSFKENKNCVKWGLPVLPFLEQTQLAVFRIEYNAFSKAKFGNFQRLLILNIYLQTIIIGEKTQFELNLMSFKWALPWSAPSGSLGLAWKTDKISAILLTIWYCSYFGLLQTIAGYCGLSC